MHILSSSCHLNDNNLYLYFSGDARGFISAPFGLLSESLSSSSSLLYQLIGKNTEDVSGGYYSSRPQAKELKSTRRMDIGNRRMDLGTRRIGLGTRRIDIEDEKKTTATQTERAVESKKRKRKFKYRIGSRRTTTSSPEQTTSAANPDSEAYPLPPMPTSDDYKNVQSREGSFEDQYKPEGLVFICKDPNNCPRPLEPPRYQNPYVRFRPNSYAQNLTPGPIHPVSNEEESSSDVNRPVKKVKKYNFRRLKNNKNTDTVPQLPEATENVPASPSSSPSENFKTPIYYHDTQKQRKKPVRLRKKPASSSPIKHSEDSLTDTLIEEAHPEPTDDEDKKMTLEDIEEMTPQEVHDMVVEKSEKKPERLTKKPSKSSTPELKKEVVQMVVDMAREKGNNITPQEASIIKDVTNEMGLGDITEKQVKIIAEVAEALGPHLDNEDVEIISETVNTVDPEISNDAIEAIADIAKKVGSEIETNDIEVIVEMVEEAEKNTKEEAATESFTSHDSEVIADKVKDAGVHMSSNEQKAIENLAMKMDPSISNKEVKVMSEILKEIGPTVAAETVEMVVKAVKDPDTDVKKEDIKNVAAMADKLSEGLKESPPEDIKVVTNMLKQVGPTLSLRESKMITKILTPLP